MIKQILLAVDLSANTIDILRQAAELSRHYGAKLTIIHVIQPLGALGHALLHTYVKPEEREEMTTTGVKSIIDQLKNDVIDTLADEIVDGKSEVINIHEVIVRTGTPVEVILQTAEDIEADMMVLGTQNSGLPGQLGSVAQKVVNLSEIPVMLVPNHHFNLDFPTPSEQLRLW